MRTGVHAHAALRSLDQRAFLGFRIWEFCARSLSQSYGHLFLREVVLRHPVRTVVGLVAYRRFARQSHRDEPLRDGIYPVGVGSVSAFHHRVAEDDGLLVAVGFCQKPLPQPGVHPGCPAGRANHLCSHLDRHDLSRSEGRMPPACQECNIRTVATRALAAGAAMHIMTSALDIAHDIFLPALRTRRFPRAILTICPYSVQPMALPILICGMEALLFTYGSGDCQDYAQWLRADRGVKPERTCLTATANARLLAVLEAIAEARAARSHPTPRGFHREGNIYLPQGASSFYG